MIKEKDLNILRDEILYLNSKGKRVKRAPKVIFGAFYYLEAVYGGIAYGETTLISSKALQADTEGSIKTAREKLLQKILSVINKRGKI